MIKKAGILYNARITDAVDLAQRLQSTLSEYDVKSWACSAADEAAIGEEIQGTVAVISLGGDGTLLRVARIVAEASLPILAVNMGTLGFNTELSTAEVNERIGDFIHGKGWIDERAMLDVELPLHSDFPITQALNDVVVGRGAVIRAIKTRVSVNSQPITTYRTDGIVVATATGSTAYSMAAGGPMLFPNASELLLTPLIPIEGPSAAIVLPSDAVVEIEVQTAHEARVSIDGQVELALRNLDAIRVQRSHKITRLLRIQPQEDFYQNILKKLSGKERIL